MSFNFSKAPSKTVVMEDKTKPTELFKYVCNMNFPVEVREPLRTKLYGSQAGFCARANVFSSILPSETQFQLSTKLKMGLGNCTEEFFVELFASNGVLLANNLKITDNPDFVNEDKNKNWLLFEDDEKINYSGIVDFIIIDQNGEPTLIDCKAPAKLPDKDNLSYVRQLQFYAAVLGFSNVHLLYQPPTITDFFGQTLNGNTSRIEITEETLLRVVEIAYFSKLCIEYELLPTKLESMKKTVQCKYCAHQAICYGEKIVELYPLVQDEDLERHLMTQAHEHSINFLNNRQKRFNAFVDKFVKVNR